MKTLILLAVVFFATTCFSEGTNLKAVIKLNKSEGKYMTLKRLVTTARSYKHMTVEQYEALRELNLRGALSQERSQAFAELLAMGVFDKFKGTPESMARDLFCYDQNPQESTTPNKGKD